MLRIISSRVQTRKSEDRTSTAGECERGAKILYRTGHLCLFYLYAAIRMQTQKTHYTVHCTLLIVPASICFYALVTRDF